MVFDYTQTYREAKPAASARPFRGEKRIEDLVRNILGDTRTVVGKHDDQRVVRMRQRYPQEAVVARRGNRLFGVHENIREDLCEKFRIAFNLRKNTGHGNFNANVLLPQRLLLGINGSSNNAVDLNFAPLLARRYRERQQILNDGGSPARLLKYDVNLAARRIIRRAFAQQIAYSQNRGERIVQFVSSSRHHLPHRGKSFLLQKLLLEFLRLGDVANGGNHSADL